MVYTLKAVYTVLFEESIDWLLLPPDVTLKISCRCNQLSFSCLFKKTHQALTI